MEKLTRRAFLTGLGLSIGAGAGKLSSGSEPRVSEEFDPGMEKLKYDYGGLESEIDEISMGHDTYGFDMKRMNWEDRFVSADIYLNGELLWEEAIIPDSGYYLVGDTSLQVNMYGGPNSTEDTIEIVVESESSSQDVPVTDLFTL